MGTTINQRIKTILEMYHDGKAARLAKTIHVAPSVISGYLPDNRNTSPSFDVLIKIIDAHPQLSVEWIVCGTEPMYKQAVRTEASEGVNLEVNLSPSQLRKLWKAIQGLKLDAN